MAAYVCADGQVRVQLRAAARCLRAWELLGLVILETPKVLGFMSWADLFPGQCSPTGGNPGSWWGLEQLAAEVDSEVFESQGIVLCPVGFSSLDSVLQNVQGRTQYSSQFNSFSAWEVLSDI